MGYELINANTFEELSSWPETTDPQAGWQDGGGVHAIVTDPPYGVIEFMEENVEKMRQGSGGVWRIPPSLDGSQRNPVPRFTVLTEEDKQMLQDYFEKLGELAYKVLRPGGHIFIASTQLLMHYVSKGFDEAGLERRDVLVRETKTLRGGDRPKGAHDHPEYSMVSSMPRVYWEPWLLYRKPFDTKLVENLETWQTGGLRRESEDRPFTDLLEDGKTGKREREITAAANPESEDSHPNVKPQSLMRELCHAALPLKQGVILDPFMGSGSTVAAAEAIGYDSVGIELDDSYYEMAKQSIPRFAEISTPIEQREDIRKTKAAEESTSLSDFS
ncbi:site-specific DNA-methyltransferase [Haloferax sp. AB510]|uniref:DNA-methyltransferase n=1 Tax=Haloferax sp. AB510 TaxID=2934172 RepID=UPI00209BEBA8|nr:site-specific DNA-methyltransferase [Haloferax sp. AB510]MCO8267448.1 site-specific DNA-methyltransferase [Haloferax sp. AB510]